MSIQKLGFTPTMSLNRFEFYRKMSFDHIHERNKNRMHLIFELQIINPHKMIVVINNE